MIHITDSTDIRIKEFMCLKDKALALDEKIVVESEKVVLKLLKSNTVVHKLLITKEFLERNKEFISLSEDSIFVVEKSIMEKVVGHNLHHGIMALADRPSYVDLIELGEKVLILNGLSSPENVGTIVRTCAAFNINSIIIDSRTCSPYIRRCIRVSMGNIFQVKVHKSQNLISTLKTMQQSGYDICSTANQDGALDLPHFSFSKKSAVIIGSEGHGIQSDILEQSNKVLRIPVNDQVAHLNAACSCSIFLYHLSLI